MSARRTSLTGEARPGLVDRENTSTPSSPGVAGTPPCTAKQPSAIGAEDSTLSRKGNVLRLQFYFIVQIIKGAGKLSMGLLKILSALQTRDKPELRKSPLCMIMCNSHHVSMTQYSLSLWDI